MPISPSVIVVDRLSKQFSVSSFSGGIFNRFCSLFRPQKRRLIALEEVSFEVAQGEKIAFIGPNGAGKSTTIKILTGIWRPSSGSVMVAGLSPSSDRQQLASQIGVLFGQRSRLWPHLPPMDAFHLLGAMYQLQKSLFQQRLDQLVELFEIGSLLQRPVKQLSLGERMRCELVATLLHRPPILFLDEPTVGLDLHAKLVIRQLLNQLSKEEGTTLFLTSHDVQDIEEVCDRTLIIDGGKLVCNSSIDQLKKRIGKKLVSVASDRQLFDLKIDGVEWITNAPFSATFEVDLQRVSLERVIQELFKEGGIKDITIEDPPLEEIIRAIYGKS